MGSVTDVMRDYDDEGPVRFGVWVRSCPRKAFKKAVAILSPRLGLIQAEQALESPGGRCVTTFDTLEEAEALTTALNDTGCDAGAGEVAPFP